MHTPVAMSCSFVCLYFHVLRLSRFPPVCSRLARLTPRPWLVEVWSAQGRISMHEVRRNTEVNARELERALPDLAQPSLSWPFLALP